MPDNSVGEGVDLYAKVYKVTKVTTAICGTIAQIYMRLVSLEGKPLVIWCSPSYLPCMKATAPGRHTIHKTSSRPLAVTRRQRPITAQHVVIQDGRQR